MAGTDKRVEKTIHNIKTAFLELIKKKHLERITVQEICTLANCSRNTFYMHFPYKEKLYETILADCVGSITAGFQSLGKISEEGDLFLIDKYIDNFMNGIIENEEILKIIMKADMNHLFNRMLSEAICVTLQTETRKTGYNNSNSPQYRLICRYTAFGFVEFSLHWLLTHEITLTEVKSVLHDILESSMVNGFKYGHKGLKIIRTENV